LTNRRRRALSEWQQLARAQLRTIASENPAAVAIVAENGLEDDGFYRSTIRLPTGELPAADGGMPVHQFEDVEVSVADTALVPPQVAVDHDRFAGQSHVLQGRRLCVYLDPAREWNPNYGMSGFLEQLWRFFGDAAMGRFDPAVALYHPVGGVLHQTGGTPMVVVRDRFPDLNRAFSRAQLVGRGANRLDLAWASAPRQDAVLAAVVVVPAALVYGAGTTLLDLLSSIARVGHPKPEAVLQAFSATAARNATGTPLYFVLAVPNKAGRHHHLVVGRLSGPLADSLRAMGSLATFDPSRIPPNIPIEWCPMSDERPEIATRRDTDRPVTAFAGKVVHVWGCGGLGSWIAEFVARADAANIAVCDPGAVGGGLLVRQNYTEADIGLNKAEALATRLRALNDRLAVEADPRHLPASLTGGRLPDCDLLIDATVSVAVGGFLDGMARNTVGTRPTIAQVAIDSRSGTLGILTVTAPEHPVGPAAIDEAVGRVVVADGSLERFHQLWQDPPPGDEIVPARGCSVPTFHGSAADMAAVAGVLVSLLGPHLLTARSGTHLVALPHAAGGPAHHFVKAPL
jgi:hypothetical protein